MPSSLKDLVRSRVNDPSVAALVIESELQPITGRGGLISAPTYARPEGDSSKLPYHAHTAEAFLPVMNDAGWYSEIRRTDDGTPVLSPRVLIDNAGSQSGRAETSLWEQQDRLGIVLPAIIVGGDRDETALPPETKDLSPAQAAAFAEAVSVAVSTWEFAHRQQDAWVRFAESAVDPKNQVWQEDGPDSLKTTIASASAQSPELLYRYFPNSAVFGFWLSSGSAARHKLSRAYSSAIVGFGAHAVKGSATKLDPAGGASNKSKLAIDPKTNALTLAGAKGKEPSKFGLGQVPGTMADRGFVCELILQQSALALPVLRSLRFTDPQQRETAITVLTLLAMTGHALAREDGFLRSGCALVTESERWGWKHRSGGNPEPMDIPSIEELAEALQEAIADAEASGLAFADPVKLRYSPVQRELLKQRVVEQLGAADAEDSQ